MSGRVLVLVAVALAAATTPAMATVNMDVPEITPGSLSTALGLLAGGVLVVRAHFRSR